MTHKKKDCFERPRWVGAKFTDTNIAPDEHVQPQLMFDYDGKSDQWNGYNPEEHMKIVEEFILGGSKSPQMVTTARKLKDTYSLEGKLWPT